MPEHGGAGYYEDGEFGIRIENLLIIKEAETPFRFGDAPYLSFERLTMCPLQRKMIDLEVRWIKIAFRSDSSLHVNLRRVMPLNAKGYSDRIKVVGSTI